MFIKARNLIYSKLFSIFITNIKTIIPVKRVILFFIYNPENIYAIILLLYEIINLRNKSINQG